LKKTLFLFTYFFTVSIHAASFEVVTLGSKGGIQDGNLTAFMLKNDSDKNYVMLDAGSVVNGLIMAEHKGAFSDITVPSHSPYSKIGYILNDRISAYFISHAHLDHVAGMIIASPDDSRKTIYALDSTNQTLSQSYFNWSAWPNFGDKGEGYKLGKYHYENLEVNQWYPVKGTSLQALALPLSHAGIKSTVFLFKNQMGEVVAYFGDTGADKIEKRGTLRQAWVLLASYVRQKKLKGIFIESSFINGTPDKQLFGHLTPKLLIEELSVLGELSGENAIQNLNVVVSHIKYSLKNTEDPKSVIRRQLNNSNVLGVNFIFPEQGDTLVFE